MSCNRNDVIDRFIDGEPMMISPTPGFRRQVRMRIYERALEERQEREEIRRRVSSRVPQW